MVVRAAGGSFAIGALGAAAGAVLLAVVEVVVATVESDPDVVVATVESGVAGEATTVLGMASGVTVELAVVVVVVVVVTGCVSAAAGVTAVAGAEVTTGVVVLLVVAGALSFMGMLLVFGAAQVSAIMFRPVTAMLFSVGPEVGVTVDCFPISSTS